MTRIWSACCTVDRRCATMIVVRPARDARACWTSFSVLLSSADVASSSTTIGGFFSRQRAIATRCFSPPESLSPRSPTTVSQPFSRRAMSGSSCAFRAASSSSSCDAPGLP
mmetsp:Transcript_54570/g.168029  ORF Transcript_54570/g.168029 Transcript_54570/m.168029 type:complete len:111 (+) Transcript_54570:520-852(+)